MEFISVSRHSMRKLTVPGENDREVLLVEGADIEQQARSPCCSKGKCNCFPGQCHVSIERRSMRTGIFS